MTAVFRPCLLHLLSAPSSRALPDSAPQSPLRRRCWWDWVSNPVYASSICLLANTAPVAFGGLGIPLITAASVTNLDLMRMSQIVGRPGPLAGADFACMDKRSYLWLETVCRDTSCPAGGRFVLRNHPVYIIKLPWSVPAGHCRGRCVYSLLGTLSKILETKARVAFPQ